MEFFSKYNTDYIIESFILNLHLLAFYDISIINDIFLVADTVCLANDCNYILVILFKLLFA